MKLRLAANLVLLLLPAATVGLIGCGMGVQAPVSSNSPVQVEVISGHLRGGQQPVSGAKVYLYATSTTANFGTATPLLSSPSYVLSDANGNFQIPPHACPAGAYVYVLALGGNPGLAAGTNNADLALAAGMGSCDVAQSATVNVDEVTTVATAFSLVNYTSSETQVGANIASTSDAVNLGDDFAAIPNLVDLPSGQARTSTLDGTGVVPQTTINSLADSLAPCINSDGTGSACAALMAAANVESGNGTPVDTFQAAVNIAKNPFLNVAPVYALATSNSPFQPTLASAPANWTIAISYPTGSPSASASLTPSSTSITQYGVQDFVATLTGISAPDYSYQWSVTGTNGTLTENGDQGRAAQTTYCSTSNIATYQPNASPTYSATDTVSVQIFSGPGCVAGNLLASAASASVSLTQSTATLPPSVPAIPTSTFTGSVALPSGFPLSASQLTVLTSIGSVTPSANGSFTVPVYTTGSQMAIVAAPSGNPLMIGWLDATHSTITPGTTAEVLAYYAMGGSQINNATDRQTLEALILSSSGLPTLTQVLQTEISANPNGFSQLDSNVKNALNAYFTSITGITPMLRPPGPGGSAPRNILVNPSPGTTQSGLSVQQVPPFEGDIVNNYRRHATAFVTRVSDNFGSGAQQDAQDFGTVDVPPANGVTGDVFATIGDMFSAYFGNQPTAYAPISSDSFSLPLTANSQSTNYTVTIVGPGAPNGISGGLTNAQATAQVQVAVGGFVTDALVPFFANFLFGGSFFTAGSAPSAAESAFATSFRNDLTNDLLNLLSTLPALQTQITSGQWGQAMASLVNSGLSSGTLQNLIAQAANQAAGNIAMPTSIASKAINSFITIVQMAGGVLQVFDSAVYVSQVGSSNAADQWTVTVTPQKVTLSPATSNLQQTGTAGTGSVTLTAALPGVTSLSGYSYLFTNTANAGDISASFGTGKGTSFCTPSISVNYIVRAVPILTVNTTDTITAQAFQGPNCKTANLVGNASATVSVLTTGVVLNPAAATITQQGPGQVGLTASVATSLPVPASYSWVLVGTQGSSAVGTLTEVGGANRSGQISYCSVSPSATYVANSSPALSSTANDKVTVQAFTSANCTSGSIATSLPSLITVTAVSVLLQPIKPALQQDQQVTMTATVQGTQATTTYSYFWSTSGSAGTLQEIGGNGQTGVSFCSTSLQVNYIPNNAPILATPIGDTVAVQAFAGAGCVSANAVSGNTSTLVQVRPVVMLTSTVIPAPIFLQAGDGYYYGIGSNTTAAFLVQYNPDLSVHKSIALPAGVKVGYSFFHAPVMGPDGNLYGYSPAGNFRVTLPAGTVTMLNNGSPAIILLGLASDGNFYGYSGYGYQAPDQTQPGIFSRMDINGNVTQLSSFPAVGSCTADLPNCNFDYASIQASDGNFYGIGGIYASQISGTQADCSVPAGEINSISTSGAFNFVAGFNTCTTYNGVVGGGVDTSFYPTQNALIEGPDGALYGETVEAGSVYIPGTENEILPTRSSTIFREAGGTIQGLHDLWTCCSGAGTINFSEGYFYNPTYGLIPGSDGNLYGSTICLAVQICTPVLFQVSTTGQFFAMNSFGTSAGYLIDHDAPVLQNNTGALMGFYTHYDVNNNPTITEFISSYKLPPPIQLTFTNPTSGVAVASVQAANPINLNWSVLNAWSLTAQQCVAQIQNFPSGAGSWSGLQIGNTTTSSSTGLPVYGGATIITPTAAGLYTYALTCGGYESGYATLQVTP